MFTSQGCFFCQHFNFESGLKHQVFSALTWKSAKEPFDIFGRVHEPYFHLIYIPIKLETFKWLLKTCLNMELRQFFHLCVIFRVFSQSCKINAISLVWFWLIMLDENSFFKQHRLIIVHRIKPIHILLDLKKSSL